MTRDNSNFNIRYHWLANLCVFEIVANILMSSVNFIFFETYTVNANLAVSSFYIFFNLSLLLHLRKKHISKSSFFIEDNTSRLQTILILVVLFLFICSKHFLLIRYCSRIDILTGSFEKIPDKKTIMLAGIIFGVFIVECILFYRHFFKNRIEHGVDLMIKKFNLDRRKTYFFGDIALSSFKVNQYVYFVFMGLEINKRYYSSEVVMEYFNMAGIGFNDLDEGHAKNIEMYAIGA